MTNPCSANTTTLPAHTPDRRALLGGVGSAAMAVMVAASTTPASAGADDAEAQLLAGLPMLSRLEMAWKAVKRPLRALQSTYEKGRPARPPEQLFRVLCGFRHGHAFYVEPDGKRRSFIPDHEVEQLRTVVEPSTGRLILDGDSLLGHGGRDLPVTAEGKRAWAEQDDSGRAAAARVVAAWDAWRAECDAYADRIGLTAAQEAYDSTKDAYWDEIDRLLALPATTLRGFACKAQILSYFRYDEEDVSRFVEELAKLSPYTATNQVEA